ncbi:hypothetical protein [Phyllobacterium sp. SB3]|uniref:hypothetical protein n=1 Tax=Phyllobacterium sp. SB3 TaxID=3156073 RepID=UPI0032AFC097
MDTVVKDGARAPWRDWLAMLGRRRSRPRLSKMERALIGANGKAPTMLVTALQARGHLDAREFSELFGIFSVVVGEDDDLEGMILAVWAGLLKDSVSS